MQTRRDVAVVGAGVVGLSIAFHLAQRGATVRVLERSGIGAGASGVQPGGVRQQWGTRVNCLLALESIRFYRSARELLQMRIDPGFRACGYLFLAQSEAALARMSENVRLQNELGIASRIVAPTEAAELVPALDAGGIAGAAWNADDGYFDRPQAIVEALGALAHVEVADVTDVDELEAEAIVVAAGADTPRLLPELPIVREERHLFFSDPIRERLLEPLIVSPERQFATKQLGDGRLLASDLSATGDPATEADRWRANLRRAFEELLPRLVFVPLSALVSASYDVTPDHQAILGRVRERVWVAAGFSGHGFMVAPAVGRIIAESVFDGREDPALAILDVARFAEGRLVPEPLVV